MTNHKLSQRAISLENETLHAEDHKLWSRRNFLGAMGLTGSVSMMLGGLPLKALGASSFAHKLMQAETDRVLVLVQLKGGNDGLNTMVPLYDYGFYKSRRPTVYIPENEIINLSNEIGMPDFMAPMQSLWQSGSMKVVHGVGYPDQNLSHFRSTDIWNSGSDANVVDDSGWLGRWFEDEYPDFESNPPTIPPAIQIGGQASLAFKGSSIQYSISVANPDQLYEIAQTGQLYNTQDVPPDCYGQELTFMRTVANSTFTYAEAIKNAYDQAGNQIEFSDSNLAEQLAIVSRLIKGRLGTKIYMVSIGGFDTHDQQGNVHPTLMNQVSQSLVDFFADLKMANMDTEVLALTFSEFGRRIEQNGSDGTDHGSAAPLMLFGPALEGNGFIGSAPDLQDPDPVGNLKFQTDFREIYATVLENWLCIGGEEVDDVMGQSFSRVENLGFSCTSTTSIDKSLDNKLKFTAYFNRVESAMHYRLFLSRPSPLRVSLLNAAGQHIATLGQQANASGSLDGQKSLRIAPGIYIVRAEALGTAVSKKIMVL